MTVTTHYESISFSYENSGELTKHAEEMERQGWKATSVSYGYLRARYRREFADANLEDLENDRLTSRS